MKCDQISVSKKYNKSFLLELVLHVNIWWSTYDSFRFNRKQLCFHSATSSTLFRCICGCVSTHKHLRETQYVVCLVRNITTRSWELKSCGNIITLWVYDNDVVQWQNFSLALVCKFQCTVFKLLSNDGTDKASGRYNKTLKVLKAYEENIRSFKKLRKHTQSFQNF